MPCKSFIIGCTLYLGASLDHAVEQNRQMFCISLEFGVYNILIWCIPKNHRLRCTLLQENISELILD